MTCFEDLQGKTLTSVESIQDAGGQDEIIFTTVNEEKYKLTHRQDCCENVYIEDICGDLEDLVDTPILVAHEASNSEDSQWGVEEWTFYNLSTIKGSVTIRWNGSSNGYYSTNVDFTQVE